MLPRQQEALPPNKQRSPVHSPVLLRVLSSSSTRHPAPRATRLSQQLGIPTGLSLSSSSVTALGMADFAGTLRAALRDTAIPPDLQEELAVVCNKYMAGVQASTARTCCLQLGGLQLDSNLTGSFVAAAAGGSASTAGCAPCQSFGR